MEKIILTATVGVFILGGISLFVAWMDKRFKKRTTKKFNERFKYLDDYYNYYNEFEKRPRR